MKKLATLLLCLALPLAALAQVPGQAQRGEMKKLDFLLGQWQGDGWFDLGQGQRRTVR